MAPLLPLPRATFLSLVGAQMVQAASRAAKLHHPQTAVLSLHSRHELHQSAHRAAQLSRQDPPGADPGAGSGLGSGGGWCGVYKGGLLKVTSLLGDSRAHVLWEKVMNGPSGRWAPFPLSSDSGSAPLLPHLPRSLRLGAKRRSSSVRTFPPKVLFPGWLPSSRSNLFSRGTLPLLRRLTWGYN